PAERPKELRKLTCFECGTELEVALSAQSTMCKRCSSHIDLRDYLITNAVSRNFKTKGQFVIELKGYVFNTEAVVGDAVIRGKFLGKLVAEHSLTLYSTADIKGSFKTGRLIIPAENHFRWKEQIAAGTAEIAGELAQVHRRARCRPAPAAKPTKAMPVGSRWRARRVGRVPALLCGSRRTLRNSGRNTTTRSGRRARKRKRSTWWRRNCADGGGKRQCWGKDPKVIWRRSRLRCG